MTFYLFKLVCFFCVTLMVMVVEVVFRVQDYREKPISAR